jgi:hypothetical protein
MMSGTSLSYNPEAKAKFHKLGKKVCQEIADLLKLEKGTYDIRSNQGGIAVSGEVTLHGEHIYIQLDQSVLSSLKDRFMYRSCKGRKDYTGGPNRWMTWFTLANYTGQAIFLFSREILVAQGQLDASH